MWIVTAILTLAGFALGYVLGMWKTDIAWIKMIGDRLGRPDR